MSTRARKSSPLARRFRALPVPSPAEALTLRTGSMRDYEALSQHHYKAARPATTTRVLVLDDARPTIVGRYLQRRGERATVGVLVESYPALNCMMRDAALGGRYAHIRSPRARARVLNDELRCISRVIIAPQWRGLGLAVRLVRAALAQPTTRMTEALAAMGRVNPFFQRAGMTAYPRPAHEHDARFTAALRHAGFEPTDLARLAHLTERIAALPRTRQGWLLDELRRWFGHGRRRGGARTADITDMLAAARTSLLAEPVYYLKVHESEAS